MSSNKFSGTSFVVGSDEKSGEISDVRVTTNAEGLAEIDIARDPKITGRRRYVVDRRTLPDGSWKRLVQAESFSPDSSTENMIETRAIVEFEEIRNAWGIEFEECWGLPAGMESPWFAPIEMVGNELLLAKGTNYVSGDAPVNIHRDNSFRNGKYSFQVGEEEILFRSGEQILGKVRCDTRRLAWGEGIAGAASFAGGSVYLEPAKPPSFSGTFSISDELNLIAPGLYEIGEHYLVSSIFLREGTQTGTIAFVKDPFPERWVRRMMGRAYAHLISPARQVPFVEDLPERVSVSVQFPETDFKEKAPEIITPYANKTGVFNAWEPDSGIISNEAKERPYDLYLPFGRLEDWGGRPLRSLGVFYPAFDFRDEESAAFPSQEGYETDELPENPEGALFFRWKDSAYFRVVRSDNLRLDYKEGYIYFENTSSSKMQGIGIIDVEPAGEWNHTLVEWGESLWVNGKEALTDAMPWGYYADKLWTEVLDYTPPSSWKPNYDLPITEEQYEEVPPIWETGLPEGESGGIELYYEDRPRTWGRVLFEGFETEVEE